MYVPHYQYRNKLKYTKEKREKRNLIIHQLQNIK